MALTASKNNFWKDAGIQLFRAFLQEQPDDRERGFRVRVRLVQTRRWHGDPRQLEPYLEEDPKRAKEEGVKEAILGWLSHAYDLDDEEDVAARALLWEYWGEDVLKTLQAWVDSEDERQRLNAFLILQGAGRLQDAEADRVLAWVLLQKGSGHEAELEMALDHWGGLLCTDLEEARARAAVAVPEPLEEVQALGRGGLPLRARETSDAEWREIVERCFYPRVEKVLLEAVAGSRSASERKAARSILDRRGALTDALRSASHLASVVAWNVEEPAYLPADLDEAISYFEGADREALHDRAAVREALRESSAIAEGKLAALEATTNLTVVEKRRRTRRWSDFKARVQTGIDRLEE
jgi:hypothetical protein